MQNPRIVELPVRPNSPALEDAAAECLATWEKLGLAGRLRVQWFPRPTLPYASLLGQVFDLSDAHDFDAILFADERRHSPLHNLRDVIGAQQAPIIDMNGRAGAFADVHFDLMDRATWTATARCVLAFRERREKVAAAHRASVDPDLQLLVHTFISCRPLTATRYPLAAEAICYPGHWTAGRAIPIAEDLVRRGLMRKTFFDRIHECGHCSSRRLSVREECPSCRSADLADTELIHHYHCATLLPEGQFRQGSALVCPKCRQQLRNYGKDYDKPGRAQQCQACGDTTSEPGVGFTCLDCNAHTDGEAIRRIDVYSYAISDQGVRLLTQPVASSLIPGLPGSLVTALEAARASNADKIAVAEVKYGAQSAIVSAKGEATFQRLRRLFLENMSNYLADSASLHPGEAADYFVLANDDNWKLVDDLDALIVRSEAILSDKLEPTVRIASRSARASA